ncbi:Pentatricopeptide repeat-containing protein [Platanthera guangdongensis]|uniref:Pentatricopeptide repeat-containing protein n=1 Tax=Platanthera guangdongensis TaxID=2320717 RepID=A0ABR2MU96_9ASPA
MLLLKRRKFVSSSQFHFHFPSRSPSSHRSPTSTCALHAADPYSPPSSDTAGDLSSLRLSLLGSLARRGLLSAACNVLERIITSSSSIEAAAALDYALSLGVPIDHGRILRSLVSAGQLLKADALFIHSAKETSPADPVLLNSMIECYCKLGKLSSAETYLEELFRIGHYPNARAYIASLRARCAEKKYVEAFNLFCTMAAQEGILPPLSIYNLMISSLCSIGCLDHARFMFDFMFNLGLQLTPRSYKCLVYGLSKHGRVLEAEDVCRKMESRDFWMDRALCTSLIYGYQKEGRMGLALKIFEKMKGMSCCEPDAYAYNTIIHGFLKLGYVDSARELFNQMVERGLERNVVTYSMMINWYGKNRRVERAMELMKEMNEFGIAPNLHCYTALVTSLSMERRLGKIDVACSLMEKMVSSGYDPSISTYNFLIRSICNDGRLDDVGSLVNLLVGVPSSLDAYSIKINALCKIGHVDLAVEQLDEMIHKGFKPSVSVYDSIIGSLCRAGRIKRADLIFNSMLNCGVPPDEVVYATLMKGYCVLGRAVRASQLFDQMMGRGLLPSSRAYSALINGLVKKNMFRSACHYIDRMLDDGFVPDTALYTMLVNQFSRKGEIGLALDIFDLMIRNQIEPDLIAYGSLISGLCRHKRDGGSILLARKLKTARCILFRLDSRGKFPTRMLQKQRLPSMSITEKVNFALGKVQDLINSGLVPDLHIYNGILNGLCIANRMEDVYDHITHMQDNDITPNQVTFTILMKFLIRSGDVDCAIRLFNQMNSDGYIPDKISYSTLINGFCLAGRVIEGASLGYGMQKRGLIPSKVIYDQLLQLLVSCYPSKPAIFLLEEMILHNHVPHSSNYNKLLWMLSSRTDLLEVGRVYNLVIKIGRVPDENTKRHMLETCYSQGEFSMAMNIEKNMLINNHQLLAS